MEEPQDVAVGIPGDDGVENAPPAVGTVDVAKPQGAAFEHTELVEQEVRVIVGALTNARSLRTLPDRHGLG